MNRSDLQPAYKAYRTIQAADRKRYRTPTSTSTRARVRYTNSMIMEAYRAWQTSGELEPRVHVPVRAMWWQGTGL